MAGWESECIMADTESDKNLRHNRRTTDRVRLESWKSIANYLNRSVRTVRRWESSEGLPVHRHRHAKGYSVYALVAVLDAWRASHQEATHEEMSGNLKLQRPMVVNLWGRYGAVLIVTFFVGGLVNRFVISANSAVEDVVTFPRVQLDAAAYWPESFAKVLVAPIFVAWSDGRIQDAFRESRTLVQRLPVLPPEVQYYVTDYMVDFSLNMGRISDARELMENLPNGELRDALDARISFALGDMSRLPEVLLAGTAEEDLSPAQSNVLLGLAAMQAGNTVEANNNFRVASDELGVKDRGYFFVALDMLAGITMAEGNISNAINILESTMPTREAAVHNRSGLFWLICQRRLATFYRESGRETDAEQIEHSLRDWLELADDTFPLAVSLVDV
jgi:hypothetical protein